jgi:hypothetical protein
MLVKIYILALFLLPFENLDTHPTNPELGTAVPCAHSTSHCSLHYGMSVRDHLKYADELNQKKTSRNPTAVMHAQPAGRDQIASCSVVHIHNSTHASTAASTRSTESTLRALRFRDMLSLEPVWLEPGSKAS